MQPSNSAPINPKEGRHTRRLLSTLVIGCTFCFVGIGLAGVGLFLRNLGIFENLITLEITGSTEAGFTVIRNEQIHHQFLKAIAPIISTSSILVLGRTLLRHLGDD